MYGSFRVIKTGIFTDLTLVCGDQDFKVHKIVLYTQSNYFHKLLGYGFKESDQNTITLHEDDPDALNVLIKCLYRHHADITSSNSKPMTFAVKVYAIADKYDIPTLRSQAAARFSKVLSPEADLEDFINAIKTVDESVPGGDRTLWEVIIKIIRDHMEFLLAKEEFIVLIGELPLLMADLLRLTATSAKQADVADEVGYSGGGRRLGGDGWSSPTF